MTNGNSYSYRENFSEDVLDGFGNNGDCYTTQVASSSLNSSPSPSSSSASCSGGGGYIEHRVTKLDTVAGIAIKYGVEVADIRRTNGLVTDLQMFALETLKIPLPGRHPPSSVLSNGITSNGEQTRPRRPHDDVLDSFQSLRLKAPHRVSPAMSSLQGYYGLTPPKRASPKRATFSDGSEMTVYGTGRALNLENEFCTRESPASDPGFSCRRKSRSLVSLENAVMDVGNRRFSEAGDSSDADRSIRRRQKADNDPSPQRRETSLKEDSGGGFLDMIGKSLALMPKIGSRADVDPARQNSTPIGDFLSDVFVSVRKSSSTSNLQESEKASSIWPTSKWSDAIARPIFDGLPKPTTVRKNKAALD